MLPFTYKGKTSLFLKGSDIEEVFSFLRKELSSIGIEEVEQKENTLTVPVQFSLNKTSYFSRSNAIGFFNKCEILIIKEDERWCLRFEVNFTPLLLMAICFLPLAIIPVIMKGFGGLLTFLGFLSFPGFIIYLSTLSEYLIFFKNLSKSSSI